MVHNAPEVSPVCIIYEMLLLTLEFKSITNLVPVNLSDPSLFVPFTSVHSVSLQPFSGLHQSSQVLG